MKKSVFSSFIKYIFSLTLILFLILAAFAYWALHTSLPKESYLDVNKRPNSEVRAYEGDIKIVSYNIGHAQGIKQNAWDRKELDTTSTHLELLATAMKNMNADIFLLQEVDIDSHRTQRINQIEFLQEKLNFPYYACANMWEKNYVPFPYWPISDHIGYVRAANCVLSKYPLSNHHRIIFDKPSDNPFWYNWGYIDRGLQRVDVEINQQKIALINIHLEAWGKHTREEQIKVVSDYIGNIKTPLVLGGDFNTVPTDAVKKNRFSDDDDDDYENEETFSLLLQRNPNLKMESFDNNDKIYFSFPSDAPNRLLDHIFVKDLIYKDFSIQEQANTASDHLPVMANISLKD